MFNQKSDSLSTLIDPRLSSIERPRNPLPHSRVVPGAMKTLLAALTCLLILLSLAACGDDDEADTETATPASTTATTTAAASPTTLPTTPAVATTGAVTPTPPDVCAPNPDPATPDFNVVTAPAPFDQVTSPVQITGQISAFEAVYQVTIYDAQGNEIVDQFAMSDEGQTLAPFSVSIPFLVSQATPACIWVYQLSAEDGVTPLNVVQIPVTLLP